MENQSQIEPEIAPTSAPTIADLAAAKSKPHTPKKPLLMKALWIILGVLALIALGVAAYLHFAHQEKGKTEPGQSTTPDTTTEHVEESSKPKYTLEKDPETGTYEAFGSDETKNNSGEAFVEYQEAISTAPDSTPAEVFDARISQAVYLIAVGSYDEAEEALNALDPSTFSADQEERFESVSARLSAAREGEGEEE